MNSALVYARQGWPVLPVWWPTADGRCACGNYTCDSPAKHPVGPLVPHGARQATADVALIQQWWSQWPRANVGIVTGIRSGLVVVDVDPRNGGTDTLAELEVRRGSLPETITAITGGGGEHFYYSVGERVPSRLLGDGLELKGDGAYVVAPPSLHASGRVYTFEIGFTPDDRLPAEAPAWLIRPSDDERRRSSSGWFAEIWKGARLGERDNWAIRLAGRYVSFGLEDAEIETLLLSWNARNQPPVGLYPGDPDPMRWVQAKIASARRMEAWRHGLRARDGEPDQLAVFSLVDQLHEAADVMDLWR